MTPTLTRPRPLQQNLGGRLLIGAGVAAVALVGVVLMPGLRGPAFVDRVTITNPSVYAIEVDVAAEEADGWLNLGAVTHGATRDLQEVLDQGSTWLFRFSYGGREAGEMRISRSQLSQNSWRLAIPSQVGDRLASAGVPPSAY